MKHSLPVVLTWVLFLVAIGVPLVAGAESVRHSGTLLAISKETGTITLGEVGPWQMVQGVTQITRRAISVTPSTAFVQVRRDTQGVAFPGDFVETRLDPWNVAVGNFVTVECRHEGKRLIALKITRPEISGQQ